MGYWSRYERYEPYVSVAQRRANAAREMKKLTKSGLKVQPVELTGRKITTTFWGTSWCDNLEEYSDFANRLPRGQRYVRNGSVMHLQIDPGNITAKVAGTQLYHVKVDIKPLQAKMWTALKAECGGQIGSIVELLAGRLSKNVMEIVTRPGLGLFPKPSEIEMSCSCPDSAELCKHLAAVLYGVGARLDQQPELLFLLRKVDHLELVDEAAVAPVANRGSRGKARIAEGDLADVFGIELATSAAAGPAEVEKLPPLRRTRGAVKRTKADLGVQPKSQKGSSARGRAKAGAAKTGGKKSAIAKPTKDKANSPATKTPGKSRRAAK